MSAAAPFDPQPADQQPDHPRPADVLQPADDDASADPTGDHQAASSGSDDEHEVFSIGAAFGGVTGLVDAGLPGVVFLVAYTVGDSDLRRALILAVACGAILAVIRLVRRDSLQHAIGGFVGVALAAYIANRTGRPEDIYLPGLLINAGYALAYAVSILIRWPLIGLLVAALRQQSLSSWRDDPVLLRAYSRASWLWVGMFLVRLAVQLPLYLAGALVPLGVARVAMGWPLFLVTAWLTYVVVKSSVPAGYRVRKVTRNREADTAAAPPVV